MIVPLYFYFLIFIHYVGLILVTFRFRTINFAFGHGIVSFAFAVWWLNPRVGFAFPVLQWSAFALVGGFLSLFVSSSLLLSYAIQWCTGKRLSCDHTDPNWITCSQCSYRVDNISSDRCPECGRQCKSTPSYNLTANKLGPRPLKRAVFITAHILFASGLGLLFVPSVLSCRIGCGYLPTVWSRMLFEHDSKRTNTK